MTSVEGDPASDLSTIRARMTGSGRERDDIFLATAGESGRSVSEWNGFIRLKRYVL